MFTGSILVIIQRSNGDVFLSTSLINQLKKNLKPDAIDLLVKLIQKHRLWYFSFYCLFLSILLGIYNGI